MNYAHQIINTFKNSSVERILIVDDAYDAPDIDPQFAGDLLEILDGDSLRQHISKELLSDDEIEAAKDALNESELEHEAISEAMDTLYRAYLNSRNSDLDPNGFFEDRKGGTLQSLDPLVELLKQCIDDPIIETVGTGDETIQTYLNLKPDIIFMDFYLSPPKRTTHETRWQEDIDKKRSIDLLKKILSEDPDLTPAVILMSSDDVARRKDTYLSRLEERVMALRFGYLHKGWVSCNGQNLVATGDAADVLMDTSGSFKFGVTLEAALKTWKIGANKALEQLNRDLHEFDIKDFAYLLRFRLYDEVDFADYLEWFLGESLRAIVDENVEWTTEDFENLNDKKLTEAIEGAHPFPSKRIARFFDRVRFNSRENRPRKHFALGDLLKSSGKNVRMVISPDCDLVSRKGESPKASRLLTIGGKILGLKEGSADEFIFYENAPKAIKWHPKDLMTHEFTDGYLNVDNKDYEYFRSMRPMYAQMVQKAVLADLSRVGVAIPPIVDVGAPVKVFLKRNSKPIIELEGFKEARAQVFMPRGGNDKKLHANFTRRFVRDLIERVEKIEDDDLVDEHQVKRNEFMEKAEDIRKNMLYGDLKLPSDIFFKLSISQPTKVSWLELVIDISDTELISLSGEDLFHQEP